ncbi:MAG: RNA polymerase sigma factor [Planctomycetota bacterium]
MVSADQPTPYSEASTTWLTHHTITGDTRARDELVQRTMPQLLSWFAVQIRASRDLNVDPEDCVNEVWLRALERPDKLPRGPGIRAWLFGIARHVLSEHRSKAWRRRTKSDGSGTDDVLNALEDSITRASQVVARSEQHHILMKLVSTLDTEDTLLVAWYGLEGRPLADVVQRLGISPDAASKRWQRLRRDLREQGLDLGLFEADE